MSGFGRYLTWLLRHSGVEKDEGGFVSLDAIRNLGDVIKRKYDTSLEEFQRIVEEDNKKRFKLEDRGEAGWWIRCNQGHSKGKITWIIIVAEGKAKAPDISQQIAERTGLETREVVLGHIQRGGSPTAFDRVLGTRFGVKAVELVKAGKFGQMVALKGNAIVDVPLASAVDALKLVPKELYDMAKVFFG